MNESQKLKIEESVGKKVRLKYSSEVNEYWFKWSPICKFHFEDRDFIDGVIDHVVWQHGDLPFYYVKFDLGFDGAFRVDKYLLKFL